MGTEELIRKIKTRANDPTRRSSGSDLQLERFKLDPRWSKPYPPVPIEQVERTERRLGFRLPPLLVRLYTEVGNGGFGPGYGLIGLDGGFVDDFRKLTLADLYLSWVQPEVGMLPHEAWPEKMLPVCDWGGGLMSAINCATAEGQMVFLEDGDRFLEDLNFDQWMEGWIKGINLLKRARRSR